jgi:hypothetical protein
MSAPVTPVRQIVRARRVSTPPPAPVRPSTRGVSSMETTIWDALVASSSIPLLATPPRMASPIALAVTGFSVPPSTPISQISQSGLPVAPQRPRVRTLQMASASWESDEEEDENGLPLTPPPKRFRRD